MWRAENGLTPPEAIPGAQRHSGGQYSWAHLWLSVGFQQVVERSEIVDAVQVDRLEQPDRHRVLGVGGQRRRDRVVGEGDVLERLAQDVTRQSLAQQLGQLAVGRLG